MARYVALFAALYFHDVTSKNTDAQCTQDGKNNIENCVKESDSCEKTWCGLIHLPDDNKDSCDFCVCRGEILSESAARYCDNLPYETCDEAEVSRFLLRSVVQVHNRQALAQIDQWMPAKINGRFMAGNINYGVDPKVEPIINRPLNGRVNYADILTWMLLSFPSVTYLEIGVSVGRTLHRLASAATQYSRMDTTILVGLDIEPLNPRLTESGLYELVEVVEDWSTPEMTVAESQTSKSSEPTLKKEPRSSLRRFKYLSNNKDEKQNPHLQHIWYLDADLKTPEAWEALAKNFPKFNFIFSDAWHSASAIIWEFTQIVKHGLLADDFIYVWDDLVTPDMQMAFGKICVTLANVNKSIQCYYVPIAHGAWQEKEGDDIIGIITPTPLWEKMRLKDVLPAMLNSEVFGYKLT